MKRNTFALLLTLLLLPFTGARAGERVEYGRIFLQPGEDEGSVDVPEGVIFTAMGAASISGFTVRITVGEHTLENWVGRFTVSNGAAVPDLYWEQAAKNQLVGPFRVTVAKNINQTTLFCYKLTYPDDAAASEVEVPADATGDVQVVMESSEDGQNWVLAGPGPYPANGSKRKFRLRIVNPQ